MRIEKCHTTLSDDIEVLSRVEYLAGNTFKEQWNGVVTNRVMLLPVCEHHRVKNQQPHN